MDFSSLLLWHFETITFSFYSTIFVDFDFFPTRDSHFNFLVIITWPIQVIFKAGGIHGSSHVHESKYFSISYQFFRLKTHAHLLQQSHTITSPRSTTVDWNSQKISLDYPNTVDYEFSVDPKVLFHSWWVHSYLRITLKSSNLKLSQANVTSEQSTRSWLVH